MVTSFRPRSPYLPDDSVLTTVRCISNLNEIYTEFASYRLEMLEERIRKQLKTLRELQQAKKEIDTGALKSFLSEQEEFIRRTNEELVEEDKVSFGYMEEIKFPEDEEDAEKPTKRVKSV
jgi:arsenate reductase-like glutaredoxin family protein